MAAINPKEATNAFDGTQDNGTQRYGTTLNSEMWLVATVLEGARPDGAKRLVENRPNVGMWIRQSLAAILGIAYP